MQRKPINIEAAAYFGMKIIEWGCYAIIFASICYAWVGTP